MIPMLVVPTLTRHDLLGRMLGTLDAHVGHLVVIDNSGRGIVGGTGPWERMTVLPMPVNFGVAASWNLAIKMAFNLPYVMICSDDMVWPEGAAESLAEMSAEDRIVVSETWPHWCAFTIGMGVVEKVGLFDEGYYPAYYEDTEYERRCAMLGVEILKGPRVVHENASTLNTPKMNFGGRNAQTSHANAVLYASGQQLGFKPSRWRSQSWT